MALFVNDVRLDEQEVAEEVARLKPKHDEVFRSVAAEEREDQLHSWATENVIERMLLRQAAEAYGKRLSNEFMEASFRSLAAKEGGGEFLRKLRAQGRSVDDFRREFEREVCMAELLDSIMGDVPPPVEEELRRRYDAEPSRFTVPEVVRAGHIVLHVNEQRTRGAALEGIREIQGMLNDGREFEELAGRFSDCPENDGDLGLFPRGVMVEKFESAVFSMAAGEVSDIIETPVGFHIAKLYEKRAGSVRPFGEVKDALSAERVQEIKNQRLEDFVDSLRAVATIVERP